MRYANSILTSTIFYSMGGEIILATASIEYPVELGCPSEAEATRSEFLHRFRS